MNKNRGTIISVSNEIPTSFTRRSYELLNWTPINEVVSSEIYFPNLKVDIQALKYACPKAKDGDTIRIIRDSYVNYYRLEMGDKHKKAVLVFVRRGVL